MNQHRPYGLYEKLFKRVLDLLLSLFAMVILCVPMLIIAVLVLMNLGKPVIFSQERPGKNEKIFKLYKFRTMINKTDLEGNLLPDKQRLTTFGRVLRSTSLDELPELLNIIRGEMSFIGPRPLSVKYLPYYSDEERHRHDVLPGLTGLAQVNGRNSISWKEKFALDLEYVSRITFLGDLKILIQTVLIVLRHKDIGQAEQAPVSLHIQRKEQARYDNKV